MKRLMMLALVVVMVLAFCSVAVAATVRCDGGSCRGTEGSDNLKGSAKRDIAYAFGGNDNITGNGGSDELYGAVGADRVLGGAAPDELYGGSGRDRVNGESGIDDIFGGYGADTLIGGEGSDYISGGNGNDLVSAQEGTFDVISCGFGTDTAVVDSNRNGNPTDTAYSDCERVYSETAQGQQFQIR